MENEQILTIAAVYELTPEERALLLEYEANIRDLQSQMRGAANAIVRARKLGGNWQLDLPNGIFAQQQVAS